MRKFFLPLLLLPFVFLGAGCNPFSSPPAQLKPIQLEYWRTDDEPEAMTGLIAAYRQIHPNIEITYKKMPADDYGQKLIEALAEDRGPDIFSLPNAWLRGWKAKLLPLPKETTLQVMSVDAQKRIVVADKKTVSITNREFISQYVEVAAQDVILKADPAKPSDQPEDRIFGLPLSADTLALFYDKDLLKNAGIEKPPADWQALTEQATELTALDAQGGIRQSGVALGEADNVRYFFDILSALMAQNGAIMADDAGYPSFNEYPPGERGRGYPPGVEALMFYDSFAAAGSPNRSWDKAMPDSLDAFVTGRTAFYFGYPIDARDIKSRAPKLDFGLAALPQINPAKIVNVARYPVEVVSKKTKNADAAWDFLQFISQKDKAFGYLAATGRPAARRDLVDSQRTDPAIGIFANQVLTAKSWYRGVDYPKAETAFADMIRAEASPAGSDYPRIVNTAAAAVNATIK